MLKLLQLEIVHKWSQPGGEKVFPSHCDFFCIFGRSLLLFCHKEGGGGGEGEGGRGVKFLYIWSDVIFQ